MVFIKITVKNTYFAGVDANFFNIFNFLGVSFSLKAMESPRITVECWIGANSRSELD